MYPFTNPPAHFHFHSDNRENLPVNVSIVLHVHISTCSSLYLFSFFLLFRLNLRNDLSTRLMGYLHTHSLENKTACLSSCFSSVFTTQTYMSPQLLVYLPIDVPVHDPTCSFAYSLSENRLRSTCQPFYCSTCPKWHQFITLTVQFISSFSA